MKLRKLLALVLALAMVLSGSVVAFADGEDDTNENDEEIVEPGDGEYSEADANALLEIIRPYWDKLPQQFKTDNGLNAAGDLGVEDLKQDIRYNDEEYNWQFHIFWEPAEDGEGELRVDRIAFSGLGLTGKLDVSKLTALTLLWCFDNQLTSLDVSGCTELIDLDFAYNRLSSLNLSKCTKLEILSAYGNQLTSLNVSGCSKLWSLNVFDNRLTTLDLSACPALTSLDCRYNDLPNKAAVKLAPSLNVVWETWTVNESGRTIPGYLFTPQGRIPDSPTHEESTKDTTDESNHRAESAAIEAVEAAMEAISEGKTPAKVQNVTTAAGATIPAVSVKLYGVDAYLSVNSMETMADASVGLQVNLDNGAAGILIPGGFPFVDEPMRMSYLLGYKKDPYNTDLMKSFVRTPDAKTEVYKLGGGTLPTTATVTLKTKLTGSVNIYHWDEDTRRVTLLTTATAENGKMIFATKQLGNLIITTGTI